jgi:cardiolipin synthase
LNLHTVSTAILVGHWLIIVGLTMRVIMRRPPVGVSLAWLAVIFSLPFVGAFVYLLFGEKRLGHRRAERINANVGPVADWQKTLRPEYAGLDSAVGSLGEPLMVQAEKIAGFPPLPGNRVDLLGDFEAVFDRLVADIDAAQRSIHLAFYIWHEGGRAEDVVAALVRAAQRGVQCRALADAMGSKAFLRSRSARRLREAGVELIAALPTSAVRTLFARADLRNHRKIVVIDGQIAYSGSQNLVDPRCFKQGAGVGEWVDAMVRIIGPAAIPLDGVFRLDWAVETGSAFEAPLGEADAPSTRDGSIIQVAPSGPDRQPEAIHWFLLTAIYAARRELVLSTPYFVPDDSILTALETAALRGVAVTLIVPARNDSLLVRHASVAHFDDLMTAGVRIALFNGGLLHTKSLTVDGEMSLFGSVNLDMRSLWLNFEISLLVYDRNFTGRLRSLQDSYLQDSDWVNLDAWRRRPARSRFIANTCRLLGPLL